MIIGVPKEIKNHEYRVGMTPASVRELVAHGHKVYVEHNAGSGIGFGDADYANRNPSLSAASWSDRVQKHRVAKTSDG